jgi:hypothetical protein
MTRVLVIQVILVGWILNTLKCGDFLLAEDLKYMRGRFLIGSNW